MIAPLEPADPRRLGSYEILGRLGSGGMGVVYFGRTPGRRPVAIKVIASHLPQDTAFRKRFALEATAALRVGGFYTAQVVEAATEATPPWIVTAYIAGPSLHQAVTTVGPFAEDSVRVLGSGLAEGLAAIHAVGLVHRDLKPGNVILAEDGPRIIDFGIARSLDGAHTSATGIIGTLGYMSPEQARGGKVGPASDVFALGCVLAYAATGRGPYSTPADAAHPASAIYRVLNEPPDLDGLPPGLLDVVESCLDPEPTRRPEVGEVVARLAALPAAPDPARWPPGRIVELIEEQKSIAALPPTVPLRPGCRRRFAGSGARGRRAVGYGAAGAAVLVAGAVAVPLMIRGHDGGAPPPASPGTTVTTPATAHTAALTTYQPCEAMNGTIGSQNRITDTGTPGGYSAGGVDVRTCTWASSQYNGLSLSLTYASSEVTLTPGLIPTSVAGISSIPSATVSTDNTQMLCQIMWPADSGYAYAVAKLNADAGLCQVDAAFATSIFPNVP